MRVVDAATMAGIDAQTIRQGIPGFTLMESAGRAVAEQIRGSYPLSSRAIVFCGPGNNGGDGFVVARTLMACGWDTCCVVVGGHSYRGDALEHSRLYQQFGGLVVYYTAGCLPCSLDKPHTVLVDSLFGTGLHRDIDGPYLELVELINACGLPVVSVDVPSGVCSDTGQVRAVAVKAELTVTIGLAKVGLFLYPGAACVGRLHVAEIGFNPQLMASTGKAGQVLDQELLQSCLPVRLPNSHKRTCGACLVVGGSRQYRGAPYLAAEASLRSGVGLTGLAIPEEIANCGLGLRELLLYPIATESGVFDGSSQAQVVELLSRTDPNDELTRVCRPRFTSLCLGPGLGAQTETQPLIVELVSRGIPTVVDADALRALKGLSRLTNVVLTPHLGEAASLLDCSVSEICADLVSAAKRCSKRYGAVVVLKGAPTVICQGEDYWLNTTGSSVLSQGGTGDVLAGCIAGLLAQGCSVLQAAQLGAYVHGLAGRLMSQKLFSRGVLAGEIAAAIPLALKEAFSG